MGKDDIHEFAQHDTPSAVEIPKTWPALIIWAIGRFGVGIAVAGICAWAALHVYEDYSRLIQTVLTAFTEQSRVNAQLAASIESLKSSIERQSGEIHDAHIRATRNDSSK